MLSESINHKIAFFVREQLKTDMRVIVGNVKRKLAARPFKKRQRKRNSRTDRGADNISALLAVSGMTADGKTVIASVIDKRSKGCHVLLSDGSDLQLRIGLSVTDMLLFVFLGFVTEDVKLLTLAVLDDIGSYLIIGIRSAYNKTVCRRNRKNLIDSDGLALCCFELLDKNDVALFLFISLTLYCFPPVSIIANTKSTSLSN